MTDERRAPRAQLLQEVLNDPRACVELTARARRDQEIIDAAQAILIAEGALDVVSDTEPARVTRTAVDVGLGRRLASMIEALTFNMRWGGAVAAFAVAALVIGTTMTLREPQELFDPSAVVRGGQPSLQAVKVADPLAARNRLQSQLTALRVQVRPEEFIGAPALRIELPRQADARVAEVLVEQGVNVPASGGELLVYFEAQAVARP